MQPVPVAVATAAPTPTAAPAPAPATPVRPTDNGDRRRGWPYDNSDHRAAAAAAAPAPNPGSEAAMIFARRLAPNAPIPTHFVRLTTCRNETAVWGHSDINIATQLAADAVRAHVAIFKQATILWNKQKPTLPPPIQITANSFSYGPQEVITCSPSLYEICVKQLLAADEFYFKAERQKRGAGLRSVL